jgi:hypothetical protein
MTEICCQRWNSKCEREGRRGDRVVFSYFAMCPFRSHDLQCPFCDLELSSDDDVTVNIPLSNDASIYEASPEKSRCVENVFEEIFEQSYTDSDDDSYTPIVKNKSKRKICSMPEINAEIIGQNSKKSRSLPIVDLIPEDEPEYAPEIQPENTAQVVTDKYEYQNQILYYQEKGCMYSATLSEIKRELNDGSNYFIHSASIEDILFSFRKKVKSNKKSEFKSDCTCFSFIIISADDDSKITMEISASFQNRFMNPAMSFIKNEIQKISLYKLQ